MSSNDKNAVILAAQEMGYFRAKKPEKLAEIVRVLGETQGGDFEQEVRRILDAEAKQRQAAKLAREAAKLARAEAEANKPLSAGLACAAEAVEQLRPGRYIITAAQNNSDLDPVAWSILQLIAREYAAEIIVCPFTYNKSGFQQGQDAHEGIWYAPELAKHMERRHIDIGGCHVLGNANVLPTAKNPLSGFAGATPAGINAVIPASKIALQCTAALKGQKGKILLSTGTVTRPNYILRKAGTVALHEHNIGALFVDTSRGQFTARQLELMPGSDYIQDEGCRFFADGTVADAQPLALQLGDIHAEKMTDDNLRNCVALVARMMPRYLVLHDVCDFSSRNHHNLKDNVFIFAQQVQGNTVRGDLEMVADTIAKFANTMMSSGRVYIVESNHDLAIETWLKGADFKQDPINAEIYLALMAELYRSIREDGKPANMLEWACRDYLGYELPNVTFNETDASLKLGDTLGIEHGCHGDKGSNGTRGSVQGLRALGVPMNTGHTHTPSICGSVYTAGVAGSLEMGYNVGPSSWALASVLTWPNGQRQIIFQ